MEITTKGRYAVRIMVDIARHGDGYVSIADMADRQKLSQKYLEKIISNLVKANLVESKRGADGGYKLAKSAHECNVKEILDATGESTKVAVCAGEEKCPMAEKCDTMGVWHTLNHLISDYLEGVTLQSLVDKTFSKKDC
ncbi:MAG: Rrf2 family transcriptional regulator [Clostridia bacterium]|nr:Rrf2 family transcriptional regulator [Clostridia bacterium]